MSTCPVCKTPLEGGVGKSADYPRSAHRETIDRRIVFCRGCDLGIADPEFGPEESEELYAGGAFWGDVKMDTRLQAIAMPYALARSRWRFVERHLDRREGIRILDIGAGHGSFGLAAAARLGSGLREYCAVEPDPRMRARLEALWTAHGRGVRLRLVGKPSDAPDAFDVVVLSHVVEHLTDPADLLKDSLSRLSETGVLFVEVPHLDYLFKDDVYGHALFFGPSQLERLLKSAGAARVEVAVFGKSRDLSPMNFRARGASMLFEKVVQKAGPILPVPALLAYYRRRYGIDERTESGTWLRAVARGR